MCPERDDRRSQESCTVPVSVSPVNNSQQQEEEHSQQQAREAQPAAGEKSTANSRRSKEQNEQCQLQAETHEENNVSKKEVGPMTREKDTESPQRMAAEQELKVAEKAGEHQVEIEEEIEVEE